MRWTTDRVARLAALLLLITACTTGPSASATATFSPTPAPSAPPSLASSAEPSAIGELEPGRPYDATEILTAMRTSPRPGGVPAELQTDAIAAAIADAIWTVDGEAWDTILIGASCGETCAVEVAGARGGAAGDDLWTFTVDTSDGSVRTDSVELRALPEELVEQLDLMARALLDETDLEGMRLTAATWEPPPDGDRYQLSYRSGGEEGSCGLEVEIDPRQREVVDQRSVGDC